MSRHSNKVVLGVDIGGSHISAALIDANDGKIIDGSFSRSHVNSHADDHRMILDQWTETVRSSLAKMNGSALEGIGIAMPGPFDYENGISLIRGVEKYEALYGINVKEELKKRLKINSETPILFENDAACFGLGESLHGQASGYNRSLVITLGTGFGATFIQDKQILKSGPGVPDGGCLYDKPFRDGIAEDYISSRWIKNKYTILTGTPGANVAEIADRARDGKDAAAVEAFNLFGGMLAACLLPTLQSFQPELLVIGGSIAKSSDLFLPAFRRDLQGGPFSDLPVEISLQTEVSAITGAAGLFALTTNNEASWRKSPQALLPVHVDGKVTPTGQYDIYPFHHLEGNVITNGYHSLADWIIQQGTVIIDGYIGNDYNHIRKHLAEALQAKGVTAHWQDTSGFLKTSPAIDQMVAPFLGEAGSVWGTKATISLHDFFDLQKLNSLPLPAAGQVNILIGIGAALSNWDAPVIYIDLPKNELQYRMRAGSITNLGAASAAEPAVMYKRFYFVDWVVLNEYRRKIKDRITVIADGQWRDNMNWMLHDALKAGLQSLTVQPIRARPWFDPGTWGGQWMKNNIPLLNKDIINYAWSFELIAPENGIIFESNGNLLEVSFDWLMEFDATAMIGRDEPVFGLEFPIRFDFLDTFNGGNLSIQCHPSLSYIRQNFGERFTQDETYYILDCKDDAKVYLGFQENIDPAKFRHALEHSFEKNEPVDIEKYVQVLPSGKHELFLIPNGTVHSSGTDNLVLEISATPYIFTFKMYDWVRPDLNGKPRPINIDHAFKNLDFDLKGARVQEQLVSAPVVLEDQPHYQLIHLPTHPKHSYDVHRIHLLSELTIATSDQFHVLMVVEGTAVRVRTKHGEKVFSYAETFIIPAAAGEYTLINMGTEMIKIVKAFVK